MSNENNKGVIWIPGEDDKPGQVSGVNIDPHPLAVTMRLRNIYLASPDDVKAIGSQWYDKVHKAAQSAISGTSKNIRDAAGVIAAVSPNMDWERDNIAAFDELAGLSNKDWEHIRISATQPKLFDADGNAIPRTRTQGATDALAGLGISKATDANLMKAHRIWHEGADFEDVLSRRGAPKTNSFARNIADPANSRDVTIDGRASDMVVDAMRPWSGPRGIGSAALARGGETRYEAYERHHQRVAESLGIRPHELQAVTWEFGKQVERNFDPARAQGTARKGQSYQKRLGSFLSGLS